jgi:hypothetical protein
MENFNEEQFLTEVYCYLGNGNNYPPWRFFLYLFYQLKALKPNSENDLLELKVLMESISEKLSKQEYQIKWLSEQAKEFKVLQATVEALQQQISPKPPPPPPPRPPPAPDPGAVKIKISNPDSRLSGKNKT